MRKLILVILALLLLPAWSFAADEPQVKIGANFFAGFNYNISGYEEEDPRFGDNDANEFTLDRARLNVLGALDGGRYFTRVTLDAFRDSDTGRFESEVRYAYVGWAPKQFLEFKAGLFDEPYSNLSQKRYRFRALGKPFIEEYTYADAAELGVASTIALPKKIGGLSLWAANGEGGRAAETNRGKEGGVVLLINPAQAKEAWGTDLGVAGTFRYNKGETIPGPGEDVRMIYGGMAFLKWQMLNLGFEYLRSSYSFDEDEDPLVGQGYHVFADVEHSTGLGVFARYMHWDPTTENDDAVVSTVTSYTGSGEDIMQDKDAVDWLVAGLFYQATQYVRVFGYYQREWYEETDAEDDTIAAEQILGTKLDVNF